MLAGQHNQIRATRGHSHPAASTHSCHFEHHWSLQGPGPPQAYYGSQGVAPAAEPLPSRLEFRTLRRCWYVWSHLLELRAVREFKAQACAKKEAKKAGRRGSATKTDCQHLLGDLVVSRPSSRDWRARALESWEPERVVPLAKTLP